MRRVLAPTCARKVECGPIPAFSVIITAYQTADTDGAALGSAKGENFLAAPCVEDADGSRSESLQCDARAVETQLPFGLESAGLPVRRQGEGSERRRGYELILIRASV